MRHVLSTYLFVDQRLTVALLDRILRSGIREIELFCARQHLDYHNRSQIEELGHWFRDSELKVHSMHSPMFSDDVWGRTGPNSVISVTETSKAKRIGVTDEIKRALEVAEAIPFRYLVQHLGAGNEEYTEAKADAAFNALDEINLFARQRGVQVLLENIPNELSTAERLNYFVDTTHLPVFFCFDTGHAHISRGISYEYELMKDRIRSTHVHDNDGAGDMHIFPCVGHGGSIDWRATMQLLRSGDNDTPLLLELAAVGEMANPLDEVKKSFDELENL
jgi:sugar phosphate isomerase/epimerase